MTAPSPELLEQAREIVANCKNCEDWMEVAPEAAVYKCMNERVCECLLAATEIFAIGMGAGAEAEREACARLVRAGGAVFASRGNKPAAFKAVDTLKNAAAAICARSTSKQEQQR